MVAGRSVGAGQPRQRAALAALLVDAARAVPTDTLIDRVWADDAPVTVSEAVAQYLALRRRLADGLGTDPSPPLQALHRAVLRGEVETCHPATGPAQLAADLTSFAGRDGFLAGLDRLLPASITAVNPATHPAVRTAVASGAAGIGKTAIGGTDRPVARPL